MTKTPTDDSCGKSPRDRLRKALAELARQQASDSKPQVPTATRLCELAGVSRNTLYRYHSDVLQELHKIQRRRHRDSGTAKQALHQLKDENQELRDQTAKLAALVDHYFAAWQETRVMLERRERELAELRRNTKPNLVRIRN